MGPTLSVATAFVRNLGVSMPIVRFTAVEVNPRIPKTEILHATGYCMCSPISCKIGWKSYGEYK